MEREQYRVKILTKKEQDSLSDENSGRMEKTIADDLNFRARSGYHYAGHIPFSNGQIAVIFKFHSEEEPEQPS